MSRTPTQERAMLVCVLTALGCVAQEPLPMRPPLVATAAPSALPSASAPSTGQDKQAAPEQVDPYRSLANEFNLAGIERIPMRIVARHKHSREAFTEGLLFHENQLFESTGLSGRGSLRILSLSKATPEREATFWGPDFFAEGIASDGKRIVQISQDSERAIVWDPVTLQRVGEMQYKGTGWGLCYTGSIFLRSDGGSDLHQHDPVTFAERGVVEVTLGGRPLKEANELECVGDTVWANIWSRPEIVRIDRKSGAVTGMVDAQPLIDEMGHHEDDDVLKGIARDPRSGHFFLTGKLWPTIFEVELQTKG